MTFQEARTYLEEAQGRGSRMGLGAMQKLLAELGSPQEELKFIHIAGTNGKGSVLAYVSEILRKAGIRTGRYSSPAVLGYLERFWVDGEWMKEQVFAELIELIKEKVCRMEARGDELPTVFEIETAAALLFFRNRNCEIVVLETGLGGDLDATNVIDSTIIAAFTAISRDHMEILGSTLEEIASHKAGIIKPGCVVVTAEQVSEVAGVLKKRAAACRCPFHVASESQVKIHWEAFDGQEISFPGKFSDAADIIIRLNLAGHHQIQNAAVALEIVGALTAMGYCIGRPAITEGFAAVQWPGRFACVGKEPVFIVDGAHNIAAVRRLKETILRFFKDRRLIFIMGIYKDKEYLQITAEIAFLAERIYTVDLPDTGRTLAAAELREALLPFCPFTETALSVGDAVKKAVQAAKADGVIIAFGSLSYLGQVIRLVNGIPAA